MRFLGVDNYAEIFADPTFWRALVNTVAFTGDLGPARHWPAASASPCC